MTFASISHSRREQCHLISDTADTHQESFDKRHCEQNTVSCSAASRTLCCARLRLRFYEFISSMSIEGYSFGVTAFDVIGSAGNTVVYFMRDRRWCEGNRTQRKLLEVTWFLDVLDFQEIPQEANRSLLVFRFPATKTGFLLSKICSRLNQNYSLRVKAHMSVARELAKQVTPKQEDESWGERISEAGMPKFRLQASSDIF